MEHCGKKKGSNSVHLKEMVSQLLHPCCRIAQSHSEEHGRGGCTEREGSPHIFTLSKLPTLRASSYVPVCKKSLNQCSHMPRGESRIH